MPAAEARVATENADRYLTRLCQHATKMSGHTMSSHLRHRPRSHAADVSREDGAPPEIHRAECSGTDGILVLNWGQCTMHATPDLLVLCAEAADLASLTRIQDLVGGRLEKFGRREHLTVAWQPPQ
jgi:hypothetical protein